MPSALDLNQDQLMTVAEVAGILKINQQTIRNWIDAGRLPAHRLGRRVRVRRTDLARDLKGARFAVWKNPENLTGRQAVKLSQIQKTNGRPYRAYLLKEQLRQIYRLPAKQAERLLDGWLAWARRSRLPSLVKLARTITAQRDGILAAIKHGLSNECTSHCTSW
jgi:transposase